MNGATPFDKIHTAARFHANAAKRTAARFVTFAQNAQGKKSKRYCAILTKRAAVRGAFFGTENDKTLTDRAPQRLTFQARYVKIDVRRYKKIIYPLANAAKGGSG